MLDFKVDKTKNLLLIKLSGEFEKEDVARGATELKSVFLTMNPGFNVIVDIADLSRGKEEYIPVVREVMEMLEKRQPSQVIRVIGNKIAHEQFKLADKSEYITYKVKEVNSMEEAMAELGKTDE